jgi:uncharacterized protein (UPF0335 family)
LGKAPIAGFILANGSLLALLAQQSQTIFVTSAEMKGRGFDGRAVRQIVKIRKQDNSERKEMEAILELYMSALNMN